MARILAVDDEKGILNLVKRVLEKDGHQVRTLSDPAALSMNGLEAFDRSLRFSSHQGTQHVGRHQRSGAGIGAGREP